MNGLEAVAVTCPCCGAPIQLLVDLSVTRQSYVEDCTVCCQPLCVEATIAADGWPQVRVSREED